MHAVRLKVKTHNVHGEEINNLISNQFDADTDILQFCFKIIMMWQKVKSTWLVTLIFCWFDLFRVLLIGRCHIFHCIYKVIQSFKNPSFLFQLFV